MAHFGYAFFDDNFKATKSGVDFHNRTFCDYLISIYSKRAITGKHFKINNMQDEKRIAKFLRDKFEKHVDWYLEAEEAVYYGLMDRVE